MLEATCLHSIILSISFILQSLIIGKVTFYHRHAVTVCVVFAYEEHLKTVVIGEQVTPCEKINTQYSHWDM